jgi:hypothetical protein
MELEHSIALLMTLRSQLDEHVLSQREAIRLLDLLAVTHDPSRQAELIARLLAILAEIDAAGPVLRRVLPLLAKSRTQPGWAGGAATGGSAGGGESEPRRRLARPDRFRDFDTGQEPPLGLPSASSQPLRGTTTPASETPDAPRAEGASVEWIPHLEIGAPEPLSAGAEITVAVYLDHEAPRPGEHTKNLELPDVPELMLQVALSASPQLTIDGPEQAEITVRAGEPCSSTATFKLRHNGTAVEGPPVIAASFMYRWRPAGSVWCELGGTHAPGETPPPRRLPTGGHVAIDPAARAPDLTVRVLPSTDGDERHFQMTITSPHLENHPVTVPWRLASSTREFVHGYMQAFSVSQPAGRRAALIGAGKELFSLTPPEFKDAFWELADSEQLRSIFIVTSEPHIPWELMVPHDHQRTRPPLGVDYNLGRWVHQHCSSPGQQVAIIDSYVIAPAYGPGKELKFAAGEATFVAGAFNGSAITPASLEEIDKRLAEHAVTLLHFICHGHGSDIGIGQILDLEPDEQLREIQLAGLDGLINAVRDAGPMVFINACEAGRTSPSLIGSGGFAARFTELGARCVIAPVWSVKDSVAEQVARRFYTRVLAEPQTAFAEILRDLRARAYDPDDAQDSYAAYCFYGDPLTAQLPAP